MTTRISLLALSAAFQRAPLWCAALLGVSGSLIGQTPNERQAEYLNFVKAQATQLRAAERPSASREDWEARRCEIRDQLQQSFGPFPEKCPLEPKVLGVLQRDGYRVEKILFQTMPGLWMTATAYAPDIPGKHPALLAVHGHWQGARLDPVVQKRCIGPAKLGYYVLAVDAFGAGERGLSKNLGEYHREMVAATLCLPAGRWRAGGVRGDGTKLGPDALRKTFGPAMQVGSLLRADNELRLIGSDESEGIVKALR